MIPTTATDFDHTCFTDRVRAMQLEAMPWLATEQAPPVPTRRASAFDPVDWDSFTGQERVKHQLRVSIAAAKADDVRLAHTLLADRRPGIGKTALARLVAADMGVPMAEAARPMPPERLIRVIFDAGIGADTRGILLLDEAHAWKSQGNNLLTLLEEGFIQSRYIQQPFHELCVIAATTDEQDVLPALLSRFDLKPRFGPYSHEEMVQIVRTMADRAPVILDEETIHALAGASAESPRVVRQLVSEARKLAITDCVPTAESILAFCGRHADGLTDEHLEYLQMLSRLGGQAGEDTLLVQLDLDKRRLRQLERLLIDRGMVSREWRGRMLLPAGYRRAGHGTDR